MSLTAAVLATLVGTTLGLFGGGGAILTVPIFVYVLGVPVKSAVPMSLFVVCVASAVGATERWRTGRLNPRRGVMFGAAAMLGAFGGARLALLVPERLQLLIFAVAVLAAAAGMLRSAGAPERPPPQRTSASALLIGLAAPASVGVLTGVIGIGGGFLFVPALVTLFGIPLAEATGLSLMIIAMNAFAGLVGYYGRVAMEWPLMLGFTGIVVAATVAAGAVAPRIPVAVLKRAFAVLLLAIGGFVLVENLI